MSKCNGYRFGVAWIAANDETADLDVESITGFVSTLLLADLFNKEPSQVAQDIIKIRKTTSGHKVISAGFVCLPSTSGGKVLVWGESVSLRLKHSSTDAELISKRILRSEN